MDRDQSVSISDAELAIFNTVDDIVNKAVTAGDPIPALNFGGELVRSGQVRGLALAKLLYEMKSKWELFQSAGFDDNFEDVAFAHVGRSPETVTKYVRMWESIFMNEGISPEIKRKLMNRDVGDLLLLTAISREGVTDEKMEELATAPDRQELRNRIKGERGERTSSVNAIRIQLQRTEGRTYPVGALLARQGRDTVIIGTLNLDDEDELAEKAVARIVNAAKIEEI